MQPLSARCMRNLLRFRMGAASCRMGWAAASATFGLSACVSKVISMLLGMNATWCLVSCSAVCAGQVCCTVPAWCLHYAAVHVAGGRHWCCALHQTLRQRPACPELQVTVRVQHGIPVITAHQHSLDTRVDLYSTNFAANELPCSLGGVVTLPP